MSTTMKQPPTSSTSSDIEADALDWFVRRTGGHWTDADEETFQTWCSSDVQHRRAYDNCAAHSQALDLTPKSSLEILRANLAHDLAGEAQITRVPQVSRRRLLVPAFSVAAVALVAGGLGYATWSSMNDRVVFAQTFTTPRGKQQEATLPDGTKIRLDTATRLEVSFYRNRREVRLSDGQAVFSVQRDEAKPFTVVAGPTKVTVVGTKFSVRYTPALPESQGAFVAVEEGKVKVEGTLEPSAQPVFLTAAQQITVAGSGRLGEVASLAANDIAPWRNNRLSFDNTRLDQVVAEMERYGDTRLVLQDSAVADLRVTGTFNPTRLDTFVRVLPQAAPVRLVPKGDKLEVVRVPSR
jgi:transmembrane sensor